MELTSPNNNDGFERFQQLLLSMNIGEQLRPDEAAQQTGLTVETCRTVLRGLERAGLMTLGHDERYVRCRLR